MRQREKEKKDCKRTRGKKKAKNAKKKNWSINLTSKLDKTL